MSEYIDDSVFELLDAENSFLPVFADSWDSLARSRDGDRGKDGSDGSGRGSDRGSDGGDL